LCVCARVCVGVSHTFTHTGRRQGDRINGVPLAHTSDIHTNTHTHTQVGDKVIAINGAPLCDKSVAQHAPPPTHTHTHTHTYTHTQIDDKVIAINGVPLGDKSVAQHAQPPTHTHTHTYTGRRQGDRHQRCASGRQVRGAIPRSGQEQLCIHS